MKKQNWSAIYILSLFVLGFGLVLWTIFKAVNLPVQLDKTFFDTKKGIDDKFNDMAESNKVFLNKYDIKMVRIEDYCHNSNTLNINKNTFVWFKIENNKLILQSPYRKDEIYLIK